MRCKEAEWFYGSRGGIFLHGKLFFWLPGKVSTVVDKVEFKLPIFLRCRCKGIPVLLVIRVLFWYGADFVQNSIFIFVVVRIGIRSIFYYFSKRSWSGMK